MVRNTRCVVIKLVDGTIIEGKTNIGDCRRLSDLFIRGESPFIVVFDVTVGDCPGRVCFINKSQIIWAMPGEDDHRFSADSPEGYGNLGLEDEET